MQMFYGWKQPKSLQICQHYFWRKKKSAVSLQKGKNINQKSSNKIALFIPDIYHPNKV